MNILQFGKFYSCNNVGGVETYVEGLLRQLSQSNALINLVANTSFKTSQCQDAFGVPVVQVASCGRLLSASLCPTMPYWAWKLNRQYHFDVAHLHFPDPMSHVASFCLSKNVKKVVTWHSDIIRQKKVGLLYEPFLKHYLRQVDAVLVGNDLPASFPQLFRLIDDPKKIHVVPFGIQVQQYQQVSLIKIREIQNTYKNKPIIFALGRHVYYKGFEYLIRAMALIPDAVLVLGGSGPLTESFKVLANTLGLQEKVFFTGKISDADLPAYYHAAEVFCLPSIAPSEAYGLVQLEAMACGKPVVCCELNNGVTFVNQANKTGLVVPPADPEALAQALNTLLQDENLRTQMGQYAKARVEKEFTDKVMAERTLKVYQQVLGEQ